MLELECWSAEVRFSTVERALKTRIFVTKIFFKKEGGKGVAGARRPGPTGGNPQGAAVGAKWPASSFLFFNFFFKFFSFLFC